MLGTDASGDQDIWILVYSIIMRPYQIYSRSLNTAILQNESRAVVESCEGLALSHPKGSNKVPSIRCFTDFGGNRPLGHFRIVSHHGVKVPKHFHNYYPFQAVVTQHGSDSDLCQRSFRELR